MSVTLVLEAPLPQRRVTIAFRVILAIPHFLFASVLSSVAFVVIFIAWFAALFTKQVPEGLTDFLIRVLQYTARTYAYWMYLMTDVYPPFDFEGTTSYPVSLDVERADEFNRAAVFFRAILMIPKLIVLQIVQSGLAIALVFIWLITLVAGRLPNAIFEAHAAVLRYQIRVYAYVGMITAEYPRGLFGDKDTDVYVDPSAGLELEDVELGAPVAPRITTLVLSRAAKNIILLFLAFGAIFQFAFPAASIALNWDTVTAAELEDRHDELENALDRWSADAQSCGISGGPECVRSANNRLVSALERFQRDLRDMEIPSGAIVYAEAVDDDVSEMIFLLRDMNTVEDFATYQRLATDLGETAQQFDRDFADLYRAVLF